MARAKYGSDKDGNKMYLIGHTKAVYDPNGQVLEDRLQNMATASNDYTDTKINALVNGAPETLDTLKEVADAIESNATVVDALNSAIGTKANQTDVDTALDGKLDIDGDASDTTVTFTEAITRSNLVSGESSSTFWSKVAKWFADLKAVAFSGSYNDLSDTPTNATASADGLMSSSDKAKLDGIENLIPDDYIVSGSQTTISDEDSGSNIYTFTNSDGSSSTFIVKNGSTGEKGDKGEDGTSISISLTSITYQVSTSGTTVPTGTWSTSIPNVSAGQYLWTKSIVIYSDGTSTTAYSISRNGLNGSDGNDGIGISNIEQTTVSTADNGTNICTITLTDGTQSTFSFKNGSGGTNGTSATWFTGTLVTGTSTSAISVSVSGSKTGDMYLNTATCNVYRASEANSWIYVCNIKGAAGTNGTNATITGGASTIASSNLTANRALISNSSGKVAVSSITSTELGYLGGVTSNIQTQLNNKLSDFAHPSWEQTGSAEYTTNEDICVPYLYADFLAFNSNNFINMDEVTEAILDLQNSNAPDLSSYMPTSGGTFTGTVTHNANIALGNTYKIYSSSYPSFYAMYFNGSTYNYGYNATTSSYTNNFGYQSSTGGVTNNFGYRNYSSTSGKTTNYFGRNYASTTVNTTTYMENYYGYYAGANYFGYNARANYLGNSTSYPLYMQGSSYRVVGTTTGYNTKIHVSATEPTMSTGDLWFQIPS